MLKKSIIALAALGIVGTATFTASTPAEAFFICSKSGKHANSKWCERRAERKAKWAEFWQQFRIKRKKRG